jgi:hypothetical protein
MPQPLVNYEDCNINMLTYHEKVTGGSCLGEMTLIIDFRPSTVNIGFSMCGDTFGSVSTKTTDMWVNPYMIIALHLSPNKFFTISNKAL